MENLVARLQHARYDPGAGTPIPPSARPGSPSRTTTDARFPSPSLDDLRRAKDILEHPGIAAKLSALAGSPIEKGMKLLPKRWQKGVHGATEKALMKALDIAVRTMGEKRLSVASSDKLHTLAVAASGAIGGAFGIAAL